MKRICLLLLGCIVCTTSLFSQVDTITLVVSGEGESLEKATTMALRSAIEQSYGTFVSANTTILNDELVKDEIVSVSAGNVRKYDILNSYTKENGNTFVTLQATISITAMTAYAKNKGSECEFAGAAIGQQVKLNQLNKAAEKKAFENLLFELRQIAPYMFDFKLKISKPDIYETEAYIGLTVQIMANDNYKAFCNLIITTMLALARDPHTDNTHMLREGCRIRYPNPVYETKKKPKTLIGALFSPLEYIEKNCCFYNPFPMDSIEHIVLSAAEHFFIYDNNNLLYPINGEWDNFGEGNIETRVCPKNSKWKYDRSWMLRNYTLHEIGIEKLKGIIEDNSSCSTLKSFIDFENSQKCCWIEEEAHRLGYLEASLYTQDRPLLVTKTEKFKLSIEDTEKITTINISSEISDFANLCEKIEYDKLSTFDFINLYITSIKMGNSKILEKPLCKTIIKETSLMGNTYYGDTYINNLYKFGIIPKTIIDSIDCLKRIYNHKDSDANERAYKMGKRCKACDNAVEQAYQEYENYLVGILKRYYFYGK